MEKSIQKAENILSQIRKLDKEAKNYLLKKLSRLSKKEIQKKSGGSQLSKLNSLGSEIWTDIDIEKFIEEERQWD